MSQANCDSQYGVRNCLSRTLFIAPGGAPDQDRSHESRVQVRFHPLGPATIQSMDVIQEVCRGYGKTY